MVVREDIESTILRPAREAVSDASTPITDTPSPIATRRSESTKQTQLRFCTLLTQSDAHLFHYEALDWLGQAFA
jgi:hypothetical protein